MKRTLISEHLVHELAARLTAAGENWPDVAAVEPSIAAFHRANGNSRDTVSLRHEWALNVDDGDGIVVCENLIFRTESDAWIPMGRTAYSQDQHGRPGTDEDAVVRGDHQHRE